MQIIFKPGDKWVQIASIKVMLIGLLSGQFLGILLALWGAITGRKKYPELNTFLGIWALASTVLNAIEFFSPGGGLDLDVVAIMGSGGDWV